MSLGSDAWALRETFLPGFWATLTGFTGSAMFSARRIMSEGLRQSVRSTSQ